uniref:Uncharacterized protein n=1 Tax=Caenorhabditis tropicalis TaxID=1561998 RepID=A0A1I7SYB4_9PELO
MALTPIKNSTMLVDSDSSTPSPISSYLEQINDIFEKEGKISQENWNQIIEDCMVNDVQDSLNNFVIANQKAKSAMEKFGKSRVEKSEKSANQQIRDCRVKQLEALKKKVSELEKLEKELKQMNMEFAIAKCNSEHKQKIEILQNQIEEENKLHELNILKIELDRKSM